MICRALRAGPLACAALAADGGAVVLTAGPRVAVLRLASGVLVSVLPAGAPLHPWAVSLDGDPAALPLGESVHLSAPAPADLRLRRHPPRSPTASSLRLLLAAAEIDRAAVAERADSLVSCLVADLAAHGDRSDVLPLADLVGLGEGLTPSGDDVLVGFLAGLDLLQEARPAAARDRRALCDRLDPSRLARTSLLSAQMLGAACAGHYPEPLLEVLEALAGNAGAATERRRLARALEGLAAVGHRSGKDMLRGLARGLAHVA